MQSQLRAESAKGGQAKRQIDLVIEVGQ
jgi:hypothetical protein